MPPKTTKLHVVSLETALVQATLYTQRHVLGNQGPKLIDILPSKGEIAIERCLEKIVIEIKEALRRLLHARILGRESSHKCRRKTVGIHLRVEGTLWEHGSLVRVDDAADNRDTVLGNVLCDEAALDDNVHFGAARVGVRGVETACAQVADRHGDAGADEGGEGFSVGFYGAAAVADGGRVCVWGWLSKVEDVVRVVVEEFSSIDGGSYEFEHGN